MSDQQDFADVVSLPSGGGAIRGVGETCQSDLFSGSNSFNVPIRLSTARGGLGPSLAINYSAGNGNGLFGLGWQLSVPRVSRRTERGVPRYDENDVFVLSGSEELVPCRAPVTRGDFQVMRFRPRTEGLFARIERWTAADGTSHWRSTGKDGVTSVYGRTPATRIAEPGRPHRIAEWLLEETFDAKGNHILYEYAADDPASTPGSLAERNRSYCQRYLRRILYGNSHEPIGPRRSGTSERDPLALAERHYLLEAVLDYGDVEGEVPDYPVPVAASESTATWPVRPDPFSTYRTGFEVRTLRRCRRVLVFHHAAELGGATLVRSTDFGYTADPATAISLLADVTVRGYRPSDAGVHVAAMPPLEFGYSAFRPGSQRYTSMVARHGSAPTASLTDPGVQLVDLEGRGLPDLLESSPAGFLVWRNRGAGEFDPPQLMAETPAGVSLTSPDVALADLAGDGRPDLLVLSGELNGFFELGEDGWSRFTEIDRLPGQGLSDPNARLVDVTGNGLTDVVLTAPGHFVWFECLGEKGYSAPRLVRRVHDLDAFPDVAFDDPTGRVRLADMTGDGLKDFVLVGDGRVDYWPNLGYGRFGRRITMERAPRLPPDHDPERVYLVDLDGTGCADVAYADAHCVRLWLNRSGNAFGDEQRIEGTPDGTLGGLQFADVDGTGTSALVWGHPIGRRGTGFRVLDPCGGQKPYLLVEMRNNLGLTTRVRYGSSTRHRLDAEARGEPWEGVLPFPVQVVEAIEVTDHISRSRLVTTYRYWDGQYDAHEREFRGFGRVDQIDTEAFEGFGPPPGPPPPSPFPGPEAGTRVAPVETRTWFHTGMAPRRSAARGLLRDAYRGDPDAFELGDHELSDSDPDAYRALRGAVLRTEFYAHDEAPASAHPYRVTVHRHRVHEIQARVGQHPGVYHAVPADVLSFEYERTPSDPRVTHDMVLGVDAYGNVTDRVAIAYPRRGPPAEPAQALLRATYVRDDHAVRDEEGALYLGGLLYQSRSFEFSGLPWPAATPRTPLRAADVATVVADPETYLVPEAAFGGAAAGPQKRMIGCRRVYFHTDEEVDALDAPGTRTHRLPLGRPGALALPYECCETVVTEGMLAAAFADAPPAAAITAAVLHEAGYHEEDDTPRWWWASSGQRAYDAAAFYLSTARRDAFGHGSSITYDRYALLVEQVVDAVGNVITAVNDYRVLKPRRAIDPNDNVSEVAFDAHGLVVATALLGKGTEADSLAGLQIDPPESLTSDPVANAAALLSAATSRFVYDLERFWRSGGPPVIHALTRDRHAAGADPGSVRILHSATYADGFGREIQAKVQCEPGPGLAPQWVTSGWQVLNNKGKPVRRYEPVFSPTAEYEADRRVGVSPLIVYDPLERPVCTVHPDGTYEKLVVGSWSEVRWDANDTVDRPDPRTDPDVGSFMRGLAAPGAGWYERRAAGQLGEDAQDAAVKALAHAGTPEEAHFDNIGRTVGTARHPTPGTAHESRFELDPPGNVLAIVDACGRTALRQAFDLLGQRLRLDSVDAGRRWTLHDAAGRPIRSWDARGQAIHTVYDPLRRPLGVFVAVGPGPQRQISQTVYGEGVPDAKARNLRGRTYEHFDPGGVSRSERYDFKGNLLESSRRLPRDHRSLPDWAGSPALTAETFTSRWSYDALNRPLVQVTADGCEIHARYDRTGLLGGVDARLPQASQPTSVVAGAAYDARGQREQVLFGNGVTSTYTYDPLTNRLAGLHSVTAGGRVVQDITLAYDAAGNVTRLRDTAEPVLFFRNTMVAPLWDYTYDPLYRLVRASAREHLGQNAAAPVPTGPSDAPRVGLPHPHDGQAMGVYAEEYAYDAVDNLKRIKHNTATGGWTRRFAYDPPAGEAAGNRLRASSVPGDPETGPFSATYNHDANGNLVRMPHLDSLEWDHRDQLRSAAVGTLHAYYVYDSAGQRVRKVVEKNGGALVEENIYLGNLEIFRRHTSAGLRLERHTLHVMDDAQRVALIEYRVIEDGAPVGPAPLLRHQLGDHLGSSIVELGAAGEVLSREEYYPFGGTAFQSVLSTADLAEKRFRFTGRERDPETGFYAIEARSYVPWLGRWASCDPAGIVDGINLFAYARDNPIGLVDPHGTETTPSTNAKLASELNKIFVGEPKVTQLFQGAGTAPTEYIGLPKPQTEFGRLLAAYDEGLNRSLERALAGAGSAVKFLIWDNFGALLYDATGADAFKQQLLDCKKGNQGIRAFLEAGPDAAMRNIAKNMVSGLDEMKAALARGDGEGAMRGLGDFMGMLAPTMVDPAAPPTSLSPQLVTAEGVLVRSQQVVATGPPNLLPAGVMAMANAKGKAEGSSQQQQPSGAPNKDYWNKQEDKSLVAGEKQTGNQFYGQVELYRKVGDKMERLGRIMDALEVDVLTGKAGVHEWSTTRNILEGRAKYAQLRYQLSIFAEARAPGSGITIWARPQGSSVFLDVTRAEQYIGTYLHWRQ